MAPVAGKGSTTEVGGKGLTGDGQTGCRGNGRDFPTIAIELAALMHTQGKRVGQRGQGLMGLKIEIFYV